jgi:hypothetical protein
MRNPSPGCPLSPLKLVLGQFGQRINQRVYRSIQFLRHSVLPFLSNDKADKGGRLGLPATSPREGGGVVANPPSKTGKPTAQTRCGRFGFSVRNPTRR